MRAASLTSTLSTSTSSLFENAVTCTDDKTRQVVRTLLHPPARSLKLLQLRTHTLMPSQPKAKASGRAVAQCRSGCPH